MKERKELQFYFRRESDGGFTAECVSEPIFTQGDDWEALVGNVQEAVRGFYFDKPKEAKSIRVVLVSTQKP